MTNAARRTTADDMKGSAAISGATRIRPTVIAFGRFTSDGLSGQRLQHQLADCLQRVEYAVTRDSDCFEIWCPLHPIAARELLDEVLAGVIGIRGHACARDI